METKWPFIFFLTILAIASCVSMEVAEADEMECGELFIFCSGSCWRLGHCQRCCRHYGFLDGKCSLMHGDGCYCCSSSGAAAVAPKGFLS